MLDKVTKLIGDVQAFKTTSKEEIEVFRIKYLGSKGLLKELFAEFKHVDNSLKKDLGQALNKLRTTATDKVNDLKESIEEEQTSKSFYGDLTRPSEPIKLG